MKSKRKSEKPASIPAAGVDLDQVERLLAFMTQHGLEEFEYSDGNFRIRLKKPATNSNAALRHPLLTPEIVVADETAVSGVETANAPAQEIVTDVGRAEDLYVVKSPIVGTFYESPTPGGEPFVSVGGHVEAGQVLCIIEAMKLMNEIESDVSGEVMRIFVENGQPVEYGEPLFGIRPARKK